MISEKKDKNYMLYLLMVVVIITSILYYFKMLANYIAYLYNNDDYSYGLLLPFVAAYIIYIKWDKIRTITFRPTMIGIIIIIMALILNIIGELAADLYIPRISFIFSLVGIILLFGGWLLLRQLLFPVVLLIMTIPLPQLITFKLTMPLQLISSRLAAYFLRLLGVPLLLQGNIIDLGVRQLQVVDACSGLRYILALIALGVIFCYFNQRRAWKVAVLLLSLIPAAIVANALRLAFMALYPIFLEGFWHTFSGWLIFLFCLIFLIFVNKLLNWLEPPPVLKEKTEPPSNPDCIAGLENSAPSVRKMAIHTGLAIATFLIFWPVANRAAQAPNYPLKQKLEAFPMELDGWRGRKVRIDPVLILETKSHDHINADYHNSAGQLVNLWIAYYETQKKAGGFVHSPKGCFLGAGWVIKEVQIREIGPQRPIVEMLVDRTGTKLLIYYWYLQRGRWLADETWNKFFMAYDGMVKRRTDGALIRLITPLDGDLEQARERLTRFATAVTPYLFEYIPD